MRSEGNHVSVRCGESEVRLIDPSAREAGPLSITHKAGFILSVPRALRMKSSEVEITTAEGGSGPGMLKIEAQGGGRHRGAFRLSVGKVELTSDITIVDDLCSINGRNITIGGDGEDVEEVESSSVFGNLEIVLEGELPRDLYLTLPDRDPKTWRIVIGDETISPGEEGSDSLATLGERIIPCRERPGTNKHVRVLRIGRAAPTGKLVREPLPHH